MEKDKNILTENVMLYKLGKQNGKYVIEIDDEVVEKYFGWKENDILMFQTFGSYVVIKKLEGV